MPYGEYAECPQCGRIARGHDEIEEVFGYRYGGTKPQSWCKDCRAGHGSSWVDEDDDDDDDGERLSVDEAALIWMSNGMDEDYTFGYSEEELRDALR